MKINITLGSLMIALALWATAPAASLAEQAAAAADPDAKCLKCHSKKLKKTLEDGEKLSLQVMAADFEESVHSVIGCTGCHRDVGKSKHPSKQPISSRRDYSIAQNETCSQCHAAKSEAYGGSIHAALAVGGNADAPLCSDCHQTHAVRPITASAPASGEPCKACHEEIFDAYTQSVHGLARANGNTIRDNHFQAPICADCHDAHEVNAVAAVNHLQTTCLDCHNEAGRAHEEWLPNAKMHMTSVSCAACHSPASERRIDLVLYDNIEHSPVSQNGAHPEIQNRLAEINEGDEGMSSVELWKLVRLDKASEGKASNVSLRGRMEVTRAVDAHRLAPRSEAIRACDTCHKGNSEAFQNVTVSISSPDGRKQRFEADKDVLNSAISVDSVGGFYAPGGTRIKLLDGLLALAIIGGLAVPVGHITLGRILRKKKSTEQEK